MPVLEDKETWASAAISDGGRYRYALSRRLVRSGVSTSSVLFVMLNPSTADSEKDDATTRRCLGFARAWDYAQMHIVNLYAYRATNPRALAHVEDPVGPENMSWLDAMVSRADRVVVAWGVRGLGTLEACKFVQRKIPMYCLALTRNGAPQHPLYARADIMPVLFKPAD